MSTQYYYPPDQQAPERRAPQRQRGGPSWFRIWSMVIQRDAGLPQTGQMNAATQAALANFLAHGNNQMGG